MGRYLLRRLLQAIPVIFFSTFLVFLVIHLIPGDAAAVQPLIDSIVEQAERLGMQGVLREAEALRDSLTESANPTARRRQQT